MLYEKNLSITDPFTCLHYLLKFVSELFALSHCYIIVIFKSMNMNYTYVIVKAFVFQNLLS